MEKNSYTTEEAAERLGVTVGRVRQMIVDGLLRTERFGRAHVITAEAIEAAKQRRTTPGPAPKAAKQASKKGASPDGHVEVKSGKKKCGKR